MGDKKDGWTLAEPGKPVGAKFYLPMLETAIGTLERERDAAVARAEKAERERDELRQLLSQSYSEATDACEEIASAEQALNHRMLPVIAAARGAIDAWDGNAFVQHPTMARLRAALRPLDDRCDSECVVVDERRLRCTRMRGHCGPHRNGERQWIGTSICAQCPTCGKPYEPGVTTLCSNGFHCCRDCVWQDGKRLLICAECHDREVAAARDFVSENEPSERRCESCQYYVHPKYWCNYYRQNVDTVACSDWQPKKGDDEPRDSAGAGERNVKWNDSVENAGKSSQKTACTLGQFTNGLAGNAENVNGCTTRGAVSAQVDSKRNELRISAEETPQSGESNCEPQIKDGVSAIQKNAERKSRSSLPCGGEASSRSRARYAGPKEAHTTKTIPGPSTSNGCAASVIPSDTPAESEPAAVVTLPPYLDREELGRVAREVVYRLGVPHIGEWQRITDAAQAVAAHVLERQREQEPACFREWRSFCRATHEKIAIAIRLRALGVNTAVPIACLEALATGHTPAFAMSGDAAEAAKALHRWAGEEIECLRLDDTEEPDCIQAWRDYPERVQGDIISGMRGDGGGWAVAADCLEALATGHTPAFAMSGDAAEAAKALHRWAGEEIEFLRLDTEEPDDRLQGAIDAVATLHDVPVFAVAPIVEVLRDTKATTGLAGYERLPAALRKLVDGG